MNIKHILWIALLLFGFQAHSQVVLVGLQTNEAVRMEANKLNAETDFCNCKSEEIIQPALSLPFFDDFSVSTIVPNTQLWEGRSVFINKDFPFLPPNLGAATFDAIDSLGAVYTDAVWFPPTVGDRLTSRTIRLDSVTLIQRALSPADSVYLSFYYQPQGVGNDPEPWDTLVLELGIPSGDSAFVRMDSIKVIADLLMESGQEAFVMFDTLWAPVSLGCNPLVYMINYDPEPIVRGDSITILCDSVYEPVTSWEKVWWSEGMKLSEFQQIYGKNFVQVMIPILDTTWFNPAFQFRFFNYISIATDMYPFEKSNGDQWNVDYVYLNYNRSAADTTYRALAFSQRAPSFLRDYQVMPYRQYRDDPTNSVSQQFRMYISNLDNVAHNTAYEYHVNQVNGSYGYRYDGGSCNLSPSYEDSLQSCVTCPAHACPPVQALFNIDYELDTTSYIIKHYISDSSDQNPIVDSAIYRQGFYNYYAYDDGTPELGLGLSPTGSSLAYQFIVSMPDTLQGVQMYFNKTLNDVNEIYFKLKVWSDNNGQPGEVIYEQENVKVAWANGLYHFYPYMLENPIIVSGTFYVGWEKYTSSFLNIGFDSNNDKSDKIFSNSVGEWETSQFEGALLIRPIVGSRSVLGISEASSSSITQIKVYPNPASTWFSIAQSDLVNNSELQLDIVNLLGKKVMTQKGIGQQVNIEKLPSGLYVVKIQGNNRYYTAKLLINR